MSKETVSVFAVVFELRRSSRSSEDKEKVYGELGFSIIRAA
jgi:hypothetical protein